MATVPLISDDDASPEVQALYDDIRTTRGSDVVNNFWRALANQPALATETWERIKNVMAPGALDPLTKELLYIAVSIANGCEYCIHSHTAGARAKGMTDDTYAELLAVVALACTTNALADGLKVPVDPQFLA
ncbi:MAG: carboxymuconolactone decarboxylase family protein [Actinomycetota bacterium]